MSQTIRLFRRGVPPDSRFCCDQKCIDGTCPQFPPPGHRPVYQRPPRRTWRGRTRAAVAIALIGAGVCLVLGPPLLGARAPAIVVGAR